MENCSKKGIAMTDKLTRILYVEDEPDIRRWHGLRWKPWVVLR